MQAMIHMTHQATCIQFVSPTYYQLIFTAAFTITKVT